MLQGHHEAKGQEEWLKGKILKTSINNPWCALLSRIPEFKEEEVEEGCPAVVTARSGVRLSGLKSCFFCFLCDFDNLPNFLHFRSSSVKWG